MILKILTIGIFVEKGIDRGSHNVFFINFKTLRGFSNFILLADSVTTKPNNSAGIGDGWCYFRILGSNTDNLIGLRHLNRANVVMADGHAESLGKSEIFNHPLKIKAMGTAAGDVIRR